MNPNASFPLAVKLRENGASIGEVFSFLSGLYFRGKLTYAQHFGGPDVFVITSNRGLVSPEMVVTIKDLRAANGIPIDCTEERFTVPLRESATKIAETLLEESMVVLLGSIGTKKYVEPLTEIFLARVHFPAEFVGRGDMSRGGILLRCVDANTELNYIPLIGAIRHGKRPPKLEPRKV